eukprot:scaffold586_cov112-Skeletonema_dohrnii-CCMP3373.AAC.13
MADEFRIEGCHGTIAEQKDEAFYDDRSDASDDEEKGGRRSWIDWGGCMLDFWLKKGTIVMMMMKY